MQFFWIILLALGTFAIGTDEYVVAGLLPNIAREMGVSEGVAGQLITVFAFTYALAAPLLATLTINRSRKGVLVTMMALYALANGLCAISQGIGWLFAARVLAALAGSLYTPTAMAVAASLVSQQQRGRALSIIIAGLTIALVAGLPAGTYIGNLFGWRAAFFMVFGVSIIATLLILFVLPSVETVSVPSLGERILLLRDRHILLGLGVTFLVITGGYTVFTYIVPLLNHLTTLSAENLSILLFGMGLAGVIGNVLGGIGTDRLGPKKVLIGGSLLFAIILTSFTVLAYLPKTPVSHLLVVGVALAWGVVGWLIGVPINAFLASEKPTAVAIVLSLNQSALYLGIAGAGVVGGVVISFGITWQGLTGAIIVLFSTILLCFLKAPEPQVEQKSGATTKIINNP